MAIITTRRDIPLACQPKDIPHRDEPWFNLETMETEGPHRDEPWFNLETMETEGWR